MTEALKKVEVFCENELAVVGHISGFGEMLLTPSIFITSFLPGKPEYTFRDTRSLRSGSIAGCPRCGGRLVIQKGKNENADIEKLKRNAARERAKMIAGTMTSGPSGQALTAPVSKILSSNTSESEFAEIVLGKTKIVIS